MSKIEARDYVSSLNYLFTETFEGSPPAGSIYLDRGVGVFNTLENIDAKSASTFVSTTTIASHVEHLRYYLEVLTNFMQGTVQVADWEKSWLKKEVSESEWEDLKNDLRATYNAALKAFGAADLWDEDKMAEAMAMVVHTAYHLGAIRQIAKSFQPVVLTKIH